METKTCIMSTYERSAFMTYHLPKLLEAKLKANELKAKGKAYLVEYHDKKANPLWVISLHKNNKHVAFGVYEPLEGTAYVYSGPLHFQAVTQIGRKYESATYVAEVFKDSRGQPGLYKTKK